MPTVLISLHIHTHARWNHFEIQRRRMMLWSLRSVSGALALATVVTVLCFFQLLNRHRLEWTPLDVISQRSSRNWSGVRIATTVEHDHSAHGSPRVAVLIAGQCHRFAYREQEGPLFLPPTEKKSSPKFNVFIVLQCGTPQKTFTGHVETPPYMKEFVNEIVSNDSPFVQDVIDWYRSKGAENVKVQILDEKIMSSREAEITNYVTRYHGNKRDDNQNMIEFLREGNRWSIEARKFYLRHAVYEMALQQQEDKNRRYAYDAFVFWREDNYFLRPLEMEYLLSIINSTKTTTPSGDVSDRDPTLIMSDRQPQIITDASCTFGAYSDKMYAANRLGADLLFQPYYAAFLESMKRYVLFALYRKNTSKKSSNHHPFKPEMYVHDALMAAQVTPVNLGRVDVRYNDGQRCVPQIYHRCLPEETKTMVQQHRLAVCQDSDLHWR